MAAGDLSAGQQADVDRAIRQAEQTCRYEFSVYIGPARGSSREFAHRLHASLTRPARSILVMVDPSARLLEVVTGADARLALDDESARLAGAKMQAAFAGGDLVGGLVHGVGQLAEAARTGSQAISHG